MFARIAVYDVPADRLDDAVVSFGAAIEQIAASEGLHDAYVLVNRDTGQAMTLTLWSTPDTMLRTRVQASRIRNEAAQAVGADVVSVEEYQIARHETFAGATPTTDLRGDSAA
jgi:hypothetical protein